jgi:DNA-binding response OmpR family regulator
MMNEQTGYPRHTILVVDEDLQIDLGCPEMWVRGKRVDLTRTEWELLCYMARRRGQAITFEELRDKAWADKSEGPPTLGVVKQYIARLRHKLEEDAQSPKYILSKWGFGYRFMEPESPSVLADKVAGSN